MTLKTHTIYKSSLKYKGKTGKKLNKLSKNVLNNAESMSNRDLKEVYKY
jgi:hypothetical protein